MSGSLRRWWKKPRSIAVGGTVFRWSLLDRPQYRELRVWREDGKQPAFRLRLTYPEAWAIDLFRPQAVAFIIGWHEGGGRKTPGDFIDLQREPALFRGLLDLFFSPEEPEQKNAAEKGLWVLFDVDQ